MLRSSADYQSAALLLSYEPMVEAVGFSPTKARRPSRLQRGAIDALPRLAIMVPQRSNALRTQVWKTHVYLSTPLRQKWWTVTVTLRLLRIASAACYLLSLTAQSGRAYRNFTDVMPFCGRFAECSRNAR